MTPRKMEPFSLQFAEERYIHDCMYTSERTGLQYTASLL